jgi:hypothetical protein
MTGAVKVSLIRYALFGISLCAFLCLYEIGAVTVEASSHWRRAYALLSNDAPESSAAGKKAADTRSSKDPNALNDKTKDDSAGSAKETLETYKLRMDQTLEDFKQRIDQQERLVDKLAALTGIYTIIVGLAAFVGLQQARAKVAVEITALESQIDKIRADIPSVYALNHRVEDVLYTIQSELSQKWNWSDGWSYANLGAETRQNVLLSEITIGALPLFNLEASPAMKQRLADLYLSLARFYSARSEAMASPEREADRARAFQYLDRVIALGDPFLQAIACSNYGVLVLGDLEAEDAKPDADPKRRTALLEKTKYWLWRSHEICPNEAGAYYNLAIVFGQRENKPGAAVAELEKMLSRRNDMDLTQRSKFLPDGCINLACFRLKEAEDDKLGGKLISMAAAEKAALNDCTLGKELAIQYRVLDQFLGNFAHELLGDLKQLQANHPDAVAALLQRDTTVKTGWKDYLAKLTRGLTRIFKTS